MKYSRIALVCGAIVPSLLFLSQIAGAVPTIQPKVIRAYPHDSRAFTQGLVLEAGTFFESTGLRGESTLRRVNAATGNVEQQVQLPGTEFGEGLALVGQQLIQLTWRERVAHVYDVTDFHEQPGFRYEGEGWGLCFDGQRLVMSNGSSTLTLRDPNDFSVIGQLPVTNEGVAVTNLNELECVGSDVYANVWQSNAIVRIDGQTGAVLTVIQASSLLTSAEASEADVLNGIAFDPTTKHFFLTGKLWPKLFEVELPGLPPAPQDQMRDAQATPSNSKPTPAPQPTAVGLGGRGCACAIGATEDRSSVAGSAVGWFGAVGSMLGLLSRRKRRYSRFSR